MNFLYSDEWIFFQMNILDFVLNWIIFKVDSMKKWIFRKDRPPLPISGVFLLLVLFLLLFSSSKRYSFSKPHLQYAGLRDPSNPIYFLKAHDFSHPNSDGDTKKDNYKDKDNYKKGTNVTNMTEMKNMQNMENILL